MAASRERAMVVDQHSFSRPDQVRVTHADVAWNVDFADQSLSGTVTWSLDRRDPAASLRLDTKHLEISGCRVGREGALRPVAPTRHPEHAVFGSALEIPLGPGDDRAEITYRTTPKGTGLQWLEPSQTAGGRHPFLFSQAQAIHARTIVPCQDSPGVRFTYRASVTAPPGLTATMAARQLGKGADGAFRFEMPQAIPSYLVAIAVGELAYRKLGLRSGVYAEPSVVEAAASEFADTEAMIEKAESLFGPYRWEVYDLIVLPPSFPFGGMENPRLTFATPTVLAGDRSLVALVAHELAHSWSGNLVTNATWSDFWLNEGFTVYFERRIQEALYGKVRAEMEAVLGRHELVEEMKDLPPSDTILKVDLAGRDPDDAFSNVPYEKGYLFLRLIEETFGRERFDPMLKAWFDANAFTSRTTEDFLAHLHHALLDADPAKAASLRIDAWIHEPGLPANAPDPKTEAFKTAEAGAKAVAAGTTPAASIPFATWTTHERLQFLRSLGDGLGAAALRELDRAFGLSDSGNSEVLATWLGIAIKARYAPAYPALERFLTGQGRRKFLKPLYTELVKTPEGLEQAKAIYARARPLYHAIARTTIDEILGVTPK